ncbi:Two-component sensor histidine kinase [Pseudomonas sp. 8Z]|uniref:sensor histidine kinase n=1 Tax=Pseudomonas sp. 8Z TaxID=2653166 RepID=UPI0012F21AE9|nr:sensor histidine kinase [Pseudomonas sp. 8Z]VXC96672.1 Two-component sensor histidine kinase [Pseudomonas sp. 8Z]
MNTATTLSTTLAPSHHQHHEDEACPNCQPHIARARALARLKERKRIARELHDELGQQLTALLQGLGVLRIHLDRERPALLKQLERLCSITRGAIDSVRDIPNGAPPRHAQDLHNALEALVEDFRQLAAIDCRYHAPPQGIDLDKERAAHLYRIVQESLTNTLRHANASRAQVTLAQRENDYILEIFDDGQGFALNDILPDSNGLSGMRERGRQLGGPVIVFSHPGQGTIIQAIFPIRVNAKEST